MMTVSMTTATPSVSDVECRPTEKMNVKLGLLLVCTVKKLDIMQEFVGRKYLHREGRIVTEIGMKKSPNFVNQLEQCMNLLTQSQMSL